MKNIIALITILLLTACGGSDGGSDSPTTPTTEPPATEEPTEPTEPETKPFIIAVYDGYNLSISDGETLTPYTEGHAANARDGFIAIGDVLHGIDTETGETVVTYRLPIEPDAVGISTDTWSFKNIDPETAYNLGGLYKNYTQIFRNSTEHGHWSLNKWELSDVVVTETNHVIATDVLGKRRSITEPDLAVAFSAHNGMMIHSNDIVNHRSYIRTIDGDIRVNFARNYFFGADEWLKSGDEWFSWNGYVFDGVNLFEQETALSDFISTSPDAPVVVSAGTREEHGETVLYWIDCNTGMLYRYTPLVDRLENVIELYIADGSRTGGIIFEREISPVMAGDYLFYSHGGTVWKYDFISGVVSSFVDRAVIWGM
jgi:hypothetical protein